MIYQRDINSCGEACVRNVIRSFHKRSAAYLYLSSCSNFSLMKSNLLRFGIEGTGYEYQSIEKIKKLAGKKILLIIKNKRKHFVNYLCQTKHFVAYFDPEDGIQIDKKEKFNQKSTNKVLNCYKKRDIKLCRIQFLRMKEVATLIVLASLEVASLLLALYFLKYFNRLDFSFLFLLVLLLSSYLNQSYLLTVLKRLQNKIGYPYIKLGSTLRDFEAITKFQTSIIKYYSSAINGVFSFLAILIIFIYINPLDILLILITVGISLLIYLIFRRWSSKINTDMEITEVAMMRGKTIGITDYNNYCTRGEKFGKLALLEGYLRICFVVCLTAIEEYLVGEFTFVSIAAKAIMINYLNTKLVEFIKNWNKTNPFFELTKLRKDIYDNKYIIKD